jgi:FAD/FMN-containing dehydrogenase
MGKQLLRRLDGTDFEIDEETVQAFQARLHGDLLRPGNDGYDDARKIWNAMIDKRPGLIARCTGVADVIDAVNFARENRLLVSVRGVGHNIAGTALCDGGLVIDLSGMRGVWMDLDARTVRVQPGASWGDVDRETQAFGFAVPSGIVSTTGVSGLTLGGGFGWLTRKYGYTCDSLLSADVVTADGRFLTASESENPDLFWAIRGGGGNFGVVTSFHFQMRPVGPMVIAGLVLYPAEMAHEVIAFFREFASQAPEELTALLLLRIAPAAPFLPTELHGRSVAGIAVCYAGPVEEGAEAVKPLSQFGSPLVNLVKPKPFRVHQQMLDAAQPPGRYYYWKSEYMHSISNEAKDVLVSHTSEYPSPQSSVLLMQLGGAMGRVGEEESAASHRNASCVLNIGASWLDPSETDRCVRWTRDFWSDMRRFSTGGVYVNFLTQDEGQERVRAAYGVGKYERLVELKNRYDPANLFQSNQNIKPSTTGRA